MTSDIHTAILIGAGNLGWHLGHRLRESGVRILQVVSRSNASSASLAVRLAADHGIFPGDMAGGADVYIIAVTDDAIPRVISEGNFGDALVVHTAGSIPIGVFGERLRRCGVLYPLQTFTKERRVEFIEVPVFIEASAPAVLPVVKCLAEKISPLVFEMTSEKRKLLHLAAVFACNFANHMFALAAEMAKKENLPFNLLAPLIRETTGKALSMPPLEAQTGPAVRKNNSVMAEHLSLLENEPELQHLYRLISADIIRLNEKESHHS